MEGPLRGKVRAVCQRDLQLEEEDQDMEDELFKDPFGALVKNSNMLHLVGPACIFLKEGISQTLVCKNTQSVYSVSSHNPGATFFHLCEFIFIHKSKTLLFSTTPAVYSHCIAALDQTVKSHGTTHAQRGQSFSSMENYWLALWHNTLCVYVWHRLMWRFRLAFQPCKLSSGPRVPLIISVDIQSWWRQMVWVGL